MKNHPVIVGLKVMANGMFAFGLFASAGYFAWRITSAKGWLAALYFILFAEAVVYGVRFLYKLGTRVLKSMKKG